MPSYLIDPIPWQSNLKWQEVIFFLDTIKRMHGPALDPVRIFAGKIGSLYDSLSDPIEQLCLATCPDCRDNCCERATIWYDFKDIFYLYFSPGIFPGSQIRKIPGQRQPCCINLTQTGCLLPRKQRPFVCTWYFCHDQKNLCQDESFSEKIEEIKLLRQEMETLFCSITSLFIRSRRAFMV